VVSLWVSKVHGFEYDLFMDEVPLDGDVLRTRVEEPRVLAKCYGSLIISDNKNKPVTNFHPRPWFLRTSAKQHYPPPKRHYLPPNHVA